MVDVYKRQHNYIVIRHQERIGDFSLGREGFTGTGGTQNLSLIHI